VATVKKVFDASVKADSGTREGNFRALVSVWGNVDVQGDRVVKGAFENDILRWKVVGDPVPVIFSHRWDDPTMHIGAVEPDDLEETDAGLLVSGRLDINNNPIAAQVHRLMKERRVKEFSFAYDIVRERRASDGANELLELRIIELGPTLKGANPATELVGVKKASILPPMTSDHLELAKTGYDSEVVTSAFASKSNAHTSEILMHQLLEEGFDSDLVAAAFGQRIIPDHAADPQWEAEREAELDAVWQQMHQMAAI
jgi:HK97 family phage prohead protease